MRVLVDTNVVIDYISNRDPYAEDAYRIFELCVNKTITGCVAAHTIINLFYILRKELSVGERKSTIKKICRVFTVVGIDMAKITSALDNDSFSDFEDCLQSECAKEFNTECIITRNIKDYVGSNIRAVEPKEFLAERSILEGAQIDTI